jgi:hypothetical protein
MTKSPINRASALVASALLFSGLVQCQGQGTMQVRFEGQMSPGGYSESGIFFWNPSGPESVMTLQSGLVSWAPDNGTSYLMGTGGAVMRFGFNTFPATYFNLVSFDLAESSTMFPGPMSFQVVGYGAQGLMATNTITTDGVMDGPGGLPDFQTFNFGADFQHVHRVDILGDGWALDNVLISGVPEPSTAALVLLGAACAFGRLRMRRSRQ